MALTKWQIEPAASCWHAVYSAAAGAPLLDAALGEALRRAAGPEIRAASTPGSFPTEPPAGRAEAYAAAEEALTQRASIAEQLSLRTGPLREQWEARGPGLMKQLGRLTEPASGAGPVSVLPVLPVCGGHGLCLTDSRAVTIEAVLANPHAELPEVARLGWLVARVDAPRHAAAAAATAVAAIAAAEAVELATLDEPTLALAIEAWRIESPVAQPDRLAEWWRRYRESPTPWPVAVPMLQEMASR
ncbi:MAG: hypothetical protein AAGJ46_16685 [Planctomycetota bacterium]